MTAGYPSEEPIAGKPHDGICGGESQQWLSYPTFVQNLTLRGDSEGVPPTWQFRWKMAELMLERYPRMLRPFPRRHSWLRKGRISECPQRHADNVRPYVRIPKQCRPAMGAEMEPHLAPFRRIPNILLALPSGLNQPFLKDHSNPKRRARTALTLTTMTGDDARWLPGSIGSQLQWAVLMVLSLDLQYRV